ncbi:MAG: Zn-dependent hydrolase [Bacteroidota bacterium]
MKKLYQLLPVLMFTLSAVAQKSPGAKAERMETRILALGKIGANPQGGVSRVAFSEADKQGRAYIIGLMQAAKLEVRIDEAGNIIGKRPGKNPSLPVIAFGSHIDSVPFGGNYDGDVGVIGAIECIELLNEQATVTEHSLEVIVFTDEEGGLTGSSAMTGELTPVFLEQISSSGKTIAQGITELGGNIEKLKNAVRQKGELLAFLELHIEQGAVLYNGKTNIGIVEGIVGIDSWRVVVEGKANHAGTTPMNLRQDALLAASKFVIAVNESVKSVPGTQVGTIGTIKINPGASNVIPGKAEMSLELRSLTRDKILAVFEKIKTRALLIEKQTGTHISYPYSSSNPGAPTDKRIQNMMAIISGKSGFHLQANAKRCRT